VVGKSINKQIIPSIEKPFKGFRFTYDIEIGRLEKRKIKQYERKEPWKR
jgi:hypothetical protein